MKPNIEELEILHDEDIDRWAGPVTIIDPVDDLLFLAPLDTSKATKMAQVNPINEGGPNESWWYLGQIFSM